MGLNKGLRGGMRAKGDKKGIFLSFYAWLFLR
jgi:hypothetical protein